MLSDWAKRVSEAVRDDELLSEDHRKVISSLLDNMAAQALALECRLSPGARLRELPAGVVDLASERARRRGRPAAPVGVAS